MESKERKITDWMRHLSRLLCYCFSFSDTGAEGGYQNTSLTFPECLLCAEVLGSSNDLLPIVQFSKYKENALIEQDSYSSGWQFYSH